MFTIYPPHGQANFWVAAIDCDGRYYSGTCAIGKMGGSWDSIIPDFIVHVDELLRLGWRMDDNSSIFCPRCVYFKEKDLEKRKESHETKK